MDKNSIKYLILGVVLCGGLLLASMLINIDKENNNNTLSDDPNVIMSNAEEESATFKKNERELKDFTQITLDEYYQYYLGEEKKIVLIGQTGCRYCEIAEPILKGIAYKYDLDIYYLNIRNVDDDGKEGLINSNEELSDGLGTPKLIIVSNSKIHAKKNGMTDTNHYLKFFKENEIIKK